MLKKRLEQFVIVFIKYTLNFDDATWYDTLTAAAMGASFLKLLCAGAISTAQAGILSLRENQNAIKENIIMYEERLV